MANSLLDQINAELTLILTKLGGSNVPDIGTQVATLVVDVATLATNIATSKTVVDLLLDAGDAGTGLGPIGSMQQADLTNFFVDAIAAEGP